MSDLEWAMNIHRIAKLVVDFHAVENLGKINVANITVGSEEEVLIESGR